MVAEQFISLQPQHTLQVDIINDDPSLETIVLCNGSIFNFHQWDTVIRHGFLPTFGSRFRIVRYNYGKIGLSESPDEAWDIHALAHELHALIVHLGNKPVHLYGISKGTIVMQALAIHHPEVISSLAGYGWYYMGYSKLAEISRLLGRRIRDFKKLEDVWDQNTDQEIFERLWDEVYRQIIFHAATPKGTFVSKIRDYLVKRRLYPLTAPTRIKVMYSWFQYALTAIPELKTWYAENERAIEQFPLLLQHAEGDTTLPVGMAREMAIRFQQAQLTEYGKHYTHVSVAFSRFQAARIVQDYHQFIQRLSQ